MAARASPCGETNKCASHIHGGSAERPSEGCDVNVGLLHIGSATCLSLQFAIKTAILIDSGNMAKNSTEVTMPTRSNVAKPTLTSEVRICFSGHPPPSTLIAHVPTRTCSIVHIYGRGCWWCKGACVYSSACIAQRSRARSSSEHLVGHMPKAGCRTLEGRSEVYLRTTCCFHRYWCARENCLLAWACSSFHRCRGG